MRAEPATHSVVVRLVESRDELGEVSRLLDTIWGKRTESSVVPFELLRAFSVCGEYVAGAYDGAQLLGAAVAFFGLRDGHLHLHSHIAGVAPAAQGRNIGYALKQHQRDFAIANGVSQISWTFDPLVRRNAYFNLTKLGAEAVCYLEDFYGAMGDALNSDDDTDRLFVLWDTSGVAHANDTVDVDRLVAGGAVAVLSERDDGSPVTSRPSVTAAPTLLVRVPTDVVAMRASRPDLAKQWRIALRGAIAPAMDDGYRIVAVTQSGWYVLSR